VVDEGVLGGYGVFIGAEVLESLLEECVEPVESVLAGNRVTEVFGGAGVVGEVLVDMRDRVLYVVVMWS